VRLGARQVRTAGNKRRRVSDAGVPGHRGPGYPRVDAVAPGLAQMRRRRWPKATKRHKLARGGGGNRTRVLQYLTRASPGAACCVFLSPGGHAGKPPTGSAAVWCPGQSRGRAAQSSLLTDASHRAGGAPGLTASLSRSGGEGEASALCIGTYWLTVTGFTRSRPQPSARFSWINYRSRSLSPPIELYGRRHAVFVGR
jgi:hypothetical protein